MANQLTMDKSLVINHLRAAGDSERRIAGTLGVSRGVVRRHLQPAKPNSTKAPTGSGGPAASAPPTALTVSVYSKMALIDIGLLLNPPMSQYLARRL